MNERLTFIRVASVESAEEELSMKIVVIGVSGAGKTTVGHKEQ